MSTRVAVIAIIIENSESAEGVNGILHNYRQYIIGRMGIPYREKGINIISVAVDAPEQEITALSGKIGRLKGVSAKTAYSKVISSGPADSCFEPAEFMAVRNDHTDYQNRISQNTHQ